MPTYPQEDATMIALDDIQALQRKVEQLQRRADQAKGSYASWKQQLKDLFGCDSIAEAEQKLEELRDQELKLSRSYVKALAAFKREFAEVLED